MIKRTDRTNRTEGTDGGRRAPVRPGTGLLLGMNRLGMWFEGTGAGGGAWRHPFMVSLAGDAARVSMGLVIGNVAVEPMIGRVRISGEEGKAAPELKIEESVATRKGESWVCVEVTPTAAGKLDEEGEGDDDDKEGAKVVVAHRSSPVVDVGETGRAPLAMLVWRAGRARVVQVAMFHYRYETSGEGMKRRHFFS